MVVLEQSHVDAFLSSLHQITSSEIMSDDMHLGIYATDASLYQVLPIAIAVPRCEEDLIKIITLANQYKIPVMPRGSATSLAGQTTNHALVIDFTKYFNNILSIQPDQNYAIVQPGVVRDQLNQACKQYGLYFAPDPATTSRATIGGMIANNSSGTKSIKYGKTIDHVISMRVLLMDGTFLDVNTLSPKDWEAKCHQKDREGEIYRAFRKIIYEHSSAIEAAYPKVMRRVQGYPLDEFIFDENWNLAKIFCGSEGTLGIILDAKVNLEPIPKFKGAVTVHYDDRMKAIREVRHMVAFEPAAIEMLDYNVFEQSIKNSITKKYHERLIVGHPKATLSVEFFCLSQAELDHKIESFVQFLQEKSTAYAFPILLTDSILEDSWSLRKNGLGLIMGDPDGRKPIPFIEDMAIPLDHLADYISEILDICDQQKVETILYAHASVGVLHVRPGLDLTVASDIELMKEISDKVFDLVKKYGGAWSGEHGDGRNRGHRLLDYFGQEVYQCLKDVKTIFDPHYLLNPGIIINVPPMDQNLRYGSLYTETKYSFVYKYRHDHSFEALVHNCSGVGACRNHIGGTMCPSFKATSNESDSTRGRANALRLGISGQLGFESLTDPKVLDTLDLCLSCKACKSECPSNVDMSKLKSEVLQKKYNEGKITFREKAILRNPDIVPKLAGTLATIINFTQRTKVFRYLAEKVLGVDRRRTLPDYATESLASWYKKHYNPTRLPKKVALFADTYINYHETHIGKAAIKLLNDCGYEVVLANVGCCQRPRISNGFLQEAKKAGTDVANQLQPFIDQGMQIVVCEPSCTTALIDDLPDLIDDESVASSLKNNVLALDVFLANELANGNISGHFVSQSNMVLLHGHCHQKATFGIEGMKTIYGSMPNTTCTDLDAGCCGMAGSFGYEKEHYDVSKKISNLVLTPAIKAASATTTVVANGFSCRHQINDFAGKKALHWVESVQFISKGS